MKLHPFNMAVTGGVGLRKLNFLENNSSQYEQTSNA